MATDREVLEQIQQIITDQLTPVVPQEPTEIVIAVYPTDDLQKIINDNANKPLPVTLILAQGEYHGNFVLPARTALDFLTIMAGSALLPPSGQRIDLSYSGKLPLFVSGDGTNCIQTAPGASNYVLCGLEFAPLAQADHDTISLDGDHSGGALKDPALEPFNITIDQVIIRGDAVKGLHRGIRLNAKSVVITNSWIDRCFEVGRDCQAIGGWNTSGDIWIENNYLGASGENILIGGSEAHMGIIPDGITIRGNTITKDMAWKTWPTKLQVKNLLELKFGTHVLIENNHFSNNWSSAQTGWAILFTTKSQATPLEPFVTISDVTFRNNIVENVSSGINISGENGPCKNIVIENNLFRGISKVALGGDGRWIQCASGVDGLKVNHNTVTDLDGTMSFSLYTDLKRSPFITGLVITSNIFYERSYGIFVTGGTGAGAFKVISPDAICKDNAIFAGGVRKIVYPAGNFLLPVAVSPVTQFVVDGSLVAGCEISKLVASDGKPIGFIKEN